ncbi:MAG: hypothetical protein ABII39_05035 [Candidatus Micrarchaeota archaeon]
MQVLYVSQAISEFNVQNMVPVLLHSVLQDQPELGWKKIGDVHYCDVEQFESIDLTKFDMIVCTAHIQDIRESGIDKIFLKAMIKKPNLVMAIGGPVIPELAEALMHSTQAYVFFSGSGLEGFRKFCERFEENGDVDTTNIMDIPGVFHRNLQNKIVAPHSLEQKQISHKLQLYPEPLIAFLQGKEVQYLTWPMLTRCTGGCSFCDYQHLGTPMRHSTKRKLFEDMLARLTHPERIISINTMGPRFDFNDNALFEMAKERGLLFNGAFMVTDFLEKGELGERQANARRIEKLIRAGLWKMEIGVEYLNFERREEIGKNSFTNEELKRIFIAISRICEETDTMIEHMAKIGVSIDMLPTDITTTTDDILKELKESMNFFLWAQNLQPSMAVSFIGGMPYIATYPGTPEFEIVRMFHERFATEMEAYYDRDMIKTHGNNPDYTYLYFTSIPFDPVARISVMAAYEAISKLEKGGELHYFLFETLIRYAVTAHAIKEYGSMVLERPNGLPEWYIERLMASVNDCNEGLEQIGLVVIDDEKQKRISDVLFDCNEAIERGKRYLKRPVMTTPIRNPAVVELLSRTRRIRREMTAERKRGNPEWRKVAMR